LAFNKPQSHKNPHNIRSNKLKFKIFIFGWIPYYDENLDPFKILPIDTLPNFLYTHKYIHT
jgi:hypothetical protein